MNYPLMPMTPGPLSPPLVEKIPDYLALFAEKERALIYGLLWLLFLLALLLLYYFRESLSFKRKPTPREIALEGLKQNKNLDEVWRRYLHDQFGLDTVHKTTPELIPDLKQVLPKEDQELFIAFLEASDRAKFAGEELPPSLSSCLKI